MAFYIYEKQGALQTTIDKVMSCDTEMTLKGVKTLSFETLLTDELIEKVTGTNLVVEYNGEYYDVVSVARSMSK